MCIHGYLGGNLTFEEAAFEAVLSKNSHHAGALYNLALVYKNGYHDRTKAEKYLFALLNESRTKNVALREKAQVVLRIPQSVAAVVESGDWSAFRLEVEVDEVWLGAVLVDRAQPVVDVEVMQPRAFRVVS